PAAKKRKPACSGQWSSSTRGCARFVTAARLKQWSESPSQLRSISPTSCSLSVWEALLTLVLLSVESLRWQQRWTKHCPCRTSCSSVASLPTARELLPAVFVQAVNSLNR